MNMRAKRRVAVLGLLTIVGIVVYVIVDLIAQMLPPHYSPILQAESDLAVGPYGWLMTINFVVRGLFSLCLLGALTGAVTRQHLSRMGLVLVGMWSLGALLLALFPTDLAGAAPTFHGTLHLLVATLAFICVAMGELLLSLRFAGEEGLRSSAGLARVLATLALLTLLLVLATPFVHRLQNVFGLEERIFIGLVLLWMLAVAFRLTSSVSLARSPGVAENSTTGRISS